MALPEPGTLFESRYHLTEVLGAGGFATVYKATDTAADRFVAIKVLRPEPTGYSPTLKARFEREVRIIGSLRDEHTITMFDHGTSADGLLYLVTEYIEGEDLQQLLERRGRLEPAEVVHILRQVLASLHEAHAAGLLHRDIKPGNIRIYSYMGDDLRAMLLDFGIAKDVHTREQLTSDGELIGTLRYMSPEQLMSAPLGPPSDIYSLGVVAFELLLGSAGIHGGRLHEQMDRLATGHVFSVPELQRMGPLAATLDRMTARRPEERFQTAAQVLASLDPRSVPTTTHAPAIQAPAPAPTTRPQPPEPATAPFPMVWLGAIVVALALVGVAVALVASQPEPPAPQPRVRSAAGVALLTAKEPERTQEAKTKVSIVAARPDAGDSTDTPAGTHGCGLDPGFVGLGMLGWVDGLDVFDVDAFVPSSYDRDTPSPLVVMLPENGEGPQMFMNYSGMKALAEKHGFLIVSPKQARYAWEVEDASVAEVKRVINIAMNAACIDRGRIFLIGHANGGRGAEHAAAALPYIRAIATTSHRDVVGEPMPSGRLTVPYLHLAPTRDKYNKVEGGTSCDAVKPYLSLKEHEDRWRKRHGCTSESTTWLERGANVCAAWNCETTFITCHLAGGRNWPGLRERIWDKVSGQHCDGKPADFPFADTIWRFFTEHSPPSE